MTPIGDPFPGGRLSLSDRQIVGRGASILPEKSHPSDPRTALYVTLEQRVALKRHSGGLTSACVSAEGSCGRPARDDRLGSSPNRRPRSQEKSSPQKVWQHCPPGWPTESPGSEPVSTQRARTRRVRETLPRTRLPADSPGRWSEGISRLHKPRSGTSRAREQCRYIDNMSAPTVPSRRAAAGQAAQ